MKIIKIIVPCMLIYNMDVCMHFNRKHAQKIKKTSIQYTNSDQITKIDRIINDSNIFYHALFNDDVQTSIMLTYIRKGQYKNTVYMMKTDNNNTSYLKRANIEFFQKLDPIFKNTKTSQEIVKIFDNEYVARNKNEQKIVWEK